MMKRLRGVKLLLVDLPLQLRLAYCLFRDPRVPAYVKIAFGAALGVIATPIVDLPASLPIIGELDVLALTVLAVRLFIAACPRYLVEEQERLIQERRSRFDDDVRSGERIALLLFRRLSHQDQAEIANHEVTT
jgi:uncharacterized membrane protein YkvA (DUF1232 family)